MYELNSASLLESRTVLKKKKKTLYKHTKKKNLIILSHWMKIFTFSSTHTNIDLSNNKKKGPSHIQIRYKNKNEEAGSPFWLSKKEAMSTPLGQQASPRCSF